MSAEYIKSLEEVVEAADIIYKVSSNAWSRAKPVACPHGNIPRYPAHALWCDECFEGLYYAIENAKEEREHLDTKDKTDD